MKCPLCGLEETECVPHGYRSPEASEKFLGGYQGDKWDANWTPAGTKWYHYALAGVAGLFLYPVGLAALAYKRLTRPIYECRRCGEEQDQAFQCQVCGWGDLFEKKR